MVNTNSDNVIIDYFLPSNNEMTLQETLQFFLSMMGAGILLGITYVLLFHFWKL